MTDEVPSRLTMRVAGLAPHVIAFVIVLGFLGLATAVLFRAVTESPVVTMMLGVLGAITGTVVNFYFGSSQGSRAKDAQLATIAAERSSS